MTLVSMHPIFQVSIDFCDHSSPNFVWKIHIRIQLCLLSQSCNQCRAEVAELRLQELLEFGSFLLECQYWSPTMFLFANYSDNMVRRVKHLDNGLTFMPVPCTSVIFLFFYFLFLFFLCKLQPMYFKTCNLWIGLQCDWWKLRRAHFCEVPPKKKLF